MSVSKLESRGDLPTEFIVYVRKEGKITVPKQIRDVLSIKRGDLVRCRIVKVRME